MLIELKLFIMQNSYFKKICLKTRSDVNVLNFTVLFIKMKLSQSLIHKPDLWLWTNSVTFMRWGEHKCIHVGTCVQTQVRGAAKTASGQTSCLQRTSGFYGGDEMISIFYLLNNSQNFTKKNTFTLTLIIPEMWLF